MTICMEESLEESGSGSHASLELGSYETKVKGKTKDKVIYLVYRLFQDIDILELK